MDESKQKLDSTPDGALADIMTAVLKYAEACRNTMSALGTSLVHTAQEQESAAYTRVFDLVSAALVPADDVEEQILDHLRRAN